MIMALGFFCLSLVAENTPETEPVVMADSLSQSIPMAIPKEDVDLQTKANWNFYGGVAFSVSQIVAPSPHYQSWHVKAFVDFDLRLAYDFPGPWELQTGLSWQRTGSTGRFIHPEAYVLSSKLSIKGEGVRFPLTLNLHSKEYKSGLMYTIGAGPYLDWLSEMDLTSTKYYVSTDIIEHRNLKKLNGNLIPGMQIQLGSRAGRGRVELRYWMDLKGFRLLETGDDLLRRSGLMLCYGHEFFRTK